MRRLPVYIVIDISSSMRGEPIAAVNNGIDSLVQALCCDPYALETTCISIITYGTEAKQIVPLTEVYKFQKPEIIAKGQSAFGAALNLLCECIEKEVHKTQKKGRAIGDLWFSSFPTVAIPGQSPSLLLSLKR